MFFGSFLHLDHLVKYYFRASPELGKDDHFSSQERMTTLAVDNTEIMFWLSSIYYAEVELEASIINLLFICIDNIEIVFWLTNRYFSCSKFFFCFGSFLHLDHITLEPDLEHGKNNQPP